MTASSEPRRPGSARPVIVGLVAAVAVLLTVIVAAAITADGADDAGRAAPGHHTDDRGANVSATGNGHDHGADTRPAGKTGEPAAGTDGHDHAHGGPHGERDTAYADLPAATQAEVDVAREIARRYPTAAEAEADGWRKATYSLEGIGAHYLRSGALGFVTDSTDGFDLRDPEILLFDGEGSDARLAGVSYLAAGEDPEGFTGDFDVWHRHSGVCFKGIVIAEIDGHEGSTISMTPEQCQAAGGLNFPIGDLTMLHVWVGEGYEGEAPIFAHDHPQLYHGTPVGEPAAH